MWRRTVLALALVVGTVHAAQAAAPGSFTAAYHYLTCQASAIVQPSSTAELAGIIKRYAAQAAGGARVTIRSSRNKFHSSAAFPCPTAPTSPALSLPGSRRAPVTVAVLHSKLDKVLAVDRRRNTLRVGAGMDLNKFMAAATAAKMSVQIGSLTAYAGLTLAGIFATSAHGSGDRTINSLADTVVDVRFVDGRGNVVTLNRTHPDFKALNGGLGLLGVMTEMTVQLTPPTNTQLITWYNVNDNNIISDIPKMLKISPHILIFWRPDVGKYSAFITRKAAPGLRPNPAAVMTLLPNILDQGKQPNVKSIFAQLQFKLPDDPDTIGILCPVQGPRSIEAFSWATVNKKAAHNVTGFTNKMQASECDGHCLWNDQTVGNGTAQDVEFTMEHARLNEWITDVKKIFRQDLWEGGKKRFRCLGPGYLWIRFGQGTTNSYIATNTGYKRPVYVQSTWLRSRDALGWPIRYQYVLDLIEELTLCKYNARPHWGKNFDRTFTHPKCPIRPKYPGFGRQLAAQRRYDPASMYQPALFDKVARQESYALTPRCSVNQSCYCQADIHCVRGMRCVPSIAFPQYKVCKYIGPDAPGTVDISSLFAKH